MNIHDTILITGASGMVGRRLVEIMSEEGYHVLLLPTSGLLDLSNQSDVGRFFVNNKIDAVIHLAALVKGIEYNREYPASMLSVNMSMNTNIINNCNWHGIKKLLFVGSSCMYPVDCPKPIKEESLLTGALEETNEGYALSKIVGVKLCDYYRKQDEDNFISIIPCNIYGTVSNEPLNKNHVISALIKKIHTAKLRGDKEIEIWGSGSPLREFIHVDDVCSAILFMMKNYNEAGGINIGTGQHISILDLTKLIMKIIEYDGSIMYDCSKPDGMLEKYLDVSKAIALGWTAKIELEEGLRRTYVDYLNQC